MKKRQSIAQCLGFVDSHIGKKRNAFFPYIFKEKQSNEKWFLIREGREQGGREQDGTSPLSVPLVLFGIT